MSRDWILLPPAYRPVAFALSSAVVAIVIWDQLNRTEAPPQRANGAAKVIPQAEAPISQVDLSGRITAPTASSPTPEALKNDSRANASLQSLGFAARRKAAAARQAAGQPAEFAEDPIAPTAAPAAPMAEEERSRRNEEYMAGLEKEKLAMGIARVLPRRSPIAAMRGGDAFGSDDLSMLETAPEAPAQALISNTPALVSSAIARKRPVFGGSPAPEVSAANSPSPGERLDYASGIPSDDAGLVFTDGGSLSSSWTLLGLPGSYPAVDYWSRRAVLLKRSRTKILEVRAARDRVEVYFRLLDTGEASDPAIDRFATLPLEPKPVSLILLPR